MSVLVAATAVAQTPSSKEFNERYQLLVSKLGPSGVGIETLLDKWEAAYPDDADMLLGKFTYYFSKSQSSAVVAKPQDKFLGEKPVLTLKDTLGNPVNYFQVTDYDDELFGMSQKSIEKAIQLNPDRLDLRFLKVAALTGYEKESPDMALSNLKSLIIYNETQHPNWVYPGYEKVDEELSVLPSRSIASCFSSTPRRFPMRRSRKFPRRCCLTIRPMSCIWTMSGHTGS